MRSGITCLNCGKLSIGNSCGCTNDSGTLFDFGDLRLITAKITCSCSTDCIIYLKDDILIPADSNWRLGFRGWYCGVKRHHQIDMSQMYYGYTDYDSFDKVNRYFNQVERDTDVFDSTHAIQRLAERYDLIVTLPEFSKLEAYVDKGNAKFIESRGENGRILLKVKYKKKILFLVWDSEVKRIITFIHPNKF